MMSSCVQMSAFLFQVFSIIFEVLNVFALDPINICSDVGEEVWNYVPCEEYYQPDVCSNNPTLRTLDDFDLCGPSYIMTLMARNYYLGASGRRETYQDNKIALRKIKIIPKALRNVSQNSTKVTILGTEIDYPIGFSPVGLQKLAHPDGELATTSGLSSWNTIMIMSSYATSTIEEIADIAKGTPLNLWMQTYIFKNRSLTTDIIHRAERAGFKAIVITADSNASPQESCDARDGLMLPPGVQAVNVGPDFKTAMTPDATFDDLAYIAKRTKLPIVAKGILSANDAILAIQAGASAILVSNHGGRQIDYAPATIDVLPSIVDAVTRDFPNVEIYMDGGVRDGYDVYRALASGAKMVFLGRPVIWGIAYNGSSGINQVMDIITNEFRQVMTSSGNSDPSQISRNSLII